MSSIAAKVWLLDHGEILGGGQRFGLRLAGALREAGSEVTVGCDPQSPLGERCLAEGLAVAELRFPTPAVWNPATVPALRRARRLLRGITPKATVIGNHPRTHAYLYAAAPGSGSPAMVNIAHEQESAARWTARFAYRRFGALVAVGANTAREYEARLPGVTVTRVNNFLPVDYFERAGGRRRNACDSGRKSIGVLARLIPEKGIAELVAELAAPEVRPVWSETLIGGGRQDAGYAVRVEGAIERLGLRDRIRLTGEVDDVSDFLRSVDVLIVPSTGTESQPTVIIEALAHGIPVVVRESVFSPDYQELPVGRYRTAAELGECLQGTLPAPAELDELVRRFGPEQAIAGIDSAAQLARARS